MLNLSFCFVLIFSINIIEISSESDNCRLITPCKCEFENGTGIDLSLLETENYITANSSVNLRYLFHPCKNTLKVPTLVNVTDGDECSKINGYSICLQNVTTKIINGSLISNTSYTNLGEASQSSFKVASNSEAYLIYKRNKKLLTIIRLACSNIPDSYLLAPSAKSTDSLSVDESILILFSPHACVVQIDTPHSLSTGSKLVIIFFVGVFSYLALGVVVKFFIFGARGIETLPNLEFWQDFPNLLRDGGRFVQNGCKVDLLRQNNKETYDAI